MVNNSITIYHLNDNEEWCCNIYSKASIYKALGILGEKAGIKNSDTLKIRIFTNKDIMLHKDDYIYIGIGDMIPDKAKCFKVKEFADRRIGANPHWRIEAI